MKKQWMVLVAAAVTLGTAVTSMAQTGNGAPSGAHYELGIIGVTDPKTHQHLSDSGSVRRMRRQWF